MAAMTTFNVAVDNFSTFKATQQTPVWCWAACIQMVLNYNGITWTQEQVVDFTKGRVVFEMATEKEIEAALNGWRLPATAQAWSSGTTYFTGVPHPFVLSNSMGFPLKEPRRRLLIIKIDNRHVAICHKASVQWDTALADPTPTASTVNVTYFDPWDGLDKVMPAAEMSRRIAGYWQTWVALPEDRIF